MANLSIIPNDAYPLYNFTKSTVRHTNFDADGPALDPTGSAFSESDSRTFADYEGLGELEMDASTITYSSSFISIPIANFTDRPIFAHSVITIRAEAGGGTDEAVYQAGIIIPVERLLGSNVRLRVTGYAANVDADFTGKFYVDTTDGYPDNPSVKKETRKQTRATYTVLD